MPRRSPHPCESFPKAAAKAFDAVAAGCVPEASAATLALLVEHGLLERHARQHFFDDGLPPMVTYVYSVPIAHHIAWCQHWTSPRARIAKRGRRRTVGDDEPTLF